MRIFLSKPQAWYIIAAQRAVHIISPFGAVSHHASACIFLRADDIPQQVADDIHAFGVIWRETLEMFTKWWYNEVKKGGERMNFLHCDRDENMFSLHDCITDRVYFQDKELIFDFPDGFWVLPDHPASDIDKVVRTDAAKVTYTLIDDEYDVTIYVFEKSLFGQTIRKEWSIGELADKINSGKCKLEFLYRYNQGNNNAILMCNIRVDKKPYFKDCWIEITYASLEYAWNHLCEDRTW